MIRASAVFALRITTVRYERLSLAGSDGAWRCSTNRYPSSTYCISRVNSLVNIYRDAAYVRPENLFVMVHLCNHKPHSSSFSELPATAGSGSQAAGVPTSIL